MANSLRRQKRCSVKDDRRSFHNDEESTWRGNRRHRREHRSARNGLFWRCQRLIRRRQGDSDLLAELDHRTRPGILEVDHRRLRKVAQERHHQHAVDPERRPGRQAADRPQLGQCPRHLPPARRRQDGGHGRGGPGARPQRPHHFRHQVGRRRRCFRGRADRWTSSRPRASPTYRRLSTS